eukprot:CAMPEP_0172868810 /NCGR_PEP_ID=MMETSP1075-20121228/87270_1 /TAXON_ID=2916 /ORGANISM="Ceratium fusus, Strain PA161109" /LENGTH=81 /DNA_ID=CAMNT_0013718531 /DNA_START=118 /DNA_END=364 /DNA_ORIENTATION=-
MKVPALAAAWYSSAHKLNAAIAMAFATKSCSIICPVIDVTATDCLPTLDAALGVEDGGTNAHWLLTWAHIKATAATHPNAI